VAPQRGDGVGESGIETRSRRKIGTTKRARSLRQRDNQAEALLWIELKHSKLGGYKFTRQFPIGPYFADFCCRKQKLVIEIDGSQHAESMYDRKRDEFMRAGGYSVLRFWNHDVLKHRISICETVLAALDGRLAEDTDASDLRFVYAGPSPETKPLTLNQRVSAPSPNSH
jgi:very-short-patch-repair endonuclease